VENAFSLLDKIQRAKKEIAELRQKKENVRRWIPQVQITLVEPNSREADQP
jgi:hypothetical protein